MRAVREAVVMVDTRRARVCCREGPSPLFFSKALRAMSPTPRPKIMVVKRY